MCQAKAGDLHRPDRRGRDAHQYQAVERTRRRRRGFPTGRRLLDARPGLHTHDLACGGNHSGRADKREGLCGRPRLLQELRQDQFDQIALRGLPQLARACADHRRHRHFHAALLAADGLAAPQGPRVEGRRLRRLWRTGARARSGGRSPEFRLRPRCHQDRDALRDDLAPAPCRIRAGPQLEHVALWRRQHDAAQSGRLPSHRRLWPPGRTEGRERPQRRQDDKRPWRAGLHPHANQSRQDLPQSGWLGQPSSPRLAQRQLRYVHCGEHALDSAARRRLSGSAGRPTAARTRRCRKDTRRRCVGRYQDRIHAAHSAAGDTGPLSL
jgi:hypothetical protein